ncbi:MAG: hypothetical protein ACI9W6_001380 [Motiliproteus sp.]|jgi:hypothetical protein
MGAKIGRPGRLLRVTLGGCRTPISCYSARFAKVVWSSNKVSVRGIEVGLRMLWLKS